MLVPNLIVIGGIFFCVAALTRRMLPVYIGSVICLVGYLSASGLLRDMDNKVLGALVDPFGIIAVARVTEYWPISERNTRLIPLEGLLLWNRALWLAIGIVVIAITAWRFRFAQAGTSGHRERQAAGET